MWINLPENIEKSSSENFLSENVNFEIKCLTWHINEILWDFCPSCESKYFEEWKCYDCGYWMQKEMDEIIEEKDFKKIEKIEKIKWVWKKIFLLKHENKDISFYYYPNRLKEKSLKIELLYWKTKVFYEVDFFAWHKKNFNWGWEYDTFSFKLKEPENFNWKHYVLKSKTKEWIFFDYDLALRLAKIIYNKYYKK